MADLVRKQGQGVPKDVKTRLRDMHDGTHAQVQDVGDRANRVLGKVVISGGTITVTGPVTVVGAVAVTSIAPGDNNIGNVDIVTVPSTEQHLGQVGSESVSPIANPVSDTNIYAAGDCIGGVLEFADCARVAGYGGVIKNLLIIDDAGQDAQMELWLFDQAITEIGDNDPWVCTEAELHNLVAIINTVDGSWFATGTPSVSRVEASQQYTCVGVSLFGQLVNRVGTPTYGATDLSVKLGLLQD